MSTIRFLQHHEIDRIKWDRCVEQAEPTKVYALSWYLDIICPNWAGLVADDYVAVFPLPLRRKFGIHYVFHPLFAQQLGLFSTDHGWSTEDFLNAIPGKYRKITLQLQTDHLEMKRGTIESRSNYVLSIGNSEDIKKGYNQNTRRNVNKSLEAIADLSNNVTIEEFMQLKRKSAVVNLKPEQWSAMQELVSAITDRNCGKMLGVRDNDVLISAVFFVHWQDHIYYLFSCSSPAGKERRAAFRIVNDVLERYADQHKILDFEGSMDENIAFFFRGFGAKEERYCRYEKGFFQ